jgi:hypothetical protein
MFNLFQYRNDELFYRRIQSHGFKLELFMQLIRNLDVDVYHAFVRGKGAAPNLYWGISRIRSAAFPAFLFCTMFIEYHQTLLEFLNNAIFERDVLHDGPDLEVLVQIVIDLDVDVCHGALTYVTYLCYI